METGWTRSSILISAHSKSAQNGYIIWIGPISSGQMMVRVLIHELTRNLDEGNNVRKMLVLSLSALKFDFR